MHLERTYSESAVTPKALGLWAILLMVALGVFLSACAEDDVCAGCTQGCCKDGQCILFTQQSNQMCGSLGSQCQQCPEGYSCDTQQGSCTLGGGAAGQCNPACTDPQTECQQDATGGYSCQAKSFNPVGTCTASCDLGQGQCCDGARCVQAGQMCQNGQICQSGQCGQTNPQLKQCPATCSTPGSGNQCCDSITGNCIMGLSDAQHCGKPGEQCKPCASGAQCVNGACQYDGSQGGNCSRETCQGCCDASGICRKVGAIVTGSDAQDDFHCGNAGDACTSCADWGNQKCDKGTGTCGGTRGYGGKWDICVGKVNARATTIKKGLGFYFGDLLNGGQGPIARATIYGLGGPAPQPVTSSGRIVGDTAYFYMVGVCLRDVDLETLSPVGGGIVIQVHQENYGAQKLIATCQFHPNRLSLPNTFFEVDLASERGASGSLCQPEGLLSKLEVQFLPKR